MYFKAVSLWSLFSREIQASSYFFLKVTYWTLGSFTSELCDAGQGTRPLWTGRSSVRRAVKQCRAECLGWSVTYVKCMVQWCRCPGGFSERWVLVLDLGLLCSYMFAYRWQWTLLI